MLVCVPQKTTYCNKTIISSKQFNAKCYFNYVINIILQLATYNYVCPFYTWLCSPQAWYKRYKSQTEVLLRTWGDIAGWVWLCVKWRCEMKNWCLNQQEFQIFFGNWKNKTRSTRRLMWLFKLVLCNVMNFSNTAISFLGSYHEFFITMML